MCFSQFHISQIHISLLSRLLSDTYTPLPASNVRNADFTFFPPNSPTGPTEALWAQNEWIEKMVQTEPDGPFLPIFVRLTPHFTSFRSPVCSPSSPPFSGPPENTPCKTHRHLCISDHPLMQSAIPPPHFLFIPPAKPPFFWGGFRTYYLTITKSRAVESLSCHVLWLPYRAAMARNGENHKVEKKVAKNLVEKKKCAIFAKFENTNEITS